MILNSCFAQEIWKEDFLLPEKGIWGSSSGSVMTDFNGITGWTLGYAGIQVTDAGDYAKTVSTGGGRFEVCDIEGEVTWRSIEIDISGFKNVSIRLIASETGSGSNAATKYLKAFYVLDNQNPVPFTTNPVNEGNWGTAVAEQANLNGKSLQVLVKMANNYSSDKVILDEVAVAGEKGLNPPVPLYGLVINELMVDPYPAVGLPEAEYIELFNTQAFPVSVENWILRINGTEKKVPKATIQTGSYLVLCATGSLENLKQYGNVVNVVGFQGLLNSGALVEILDDKNNPIDRIAYSDTWYNNPEKGNGGWSLERMDPLRNCNQPGNWTASTDPKGGTPGAINSVYKTNPDLEPPMVRWAVAISENQVEIGFSELMDTSKMVPSNFSLEGAGSPGSIVITSGEVVILSFQTSLLKNKTYPIRFANLADECGNKLSANELVVQWNTLEPGDIFISEVLFNPRPDGEDYVEIYNRSQKLVSLDNLSLASRDDSLKLKQICPLTKGRIVIYPGEYLALTKDTSKVFPFYRIECPACFLQMAKFPSYNNDEGKVVLVDKNLQVIDEFAYSETMHTPFLFDPEGVSLERASFETRTNEKSNWHSASTSSGYGTPGSENSQAVADSLTQPKVTFEPEAFSPDSDGYNDEYLVSYRMDRPGYVANIQVFDRAGRFITGLAKNEILSIEGKISWNGKDETGQRMPIGMYVVLVEVFHETGEVYRFKDGVVLTGRVE